VTDSLSRTFEGDIEVRASAEGRTVVGIVVPYERVARVSDGGPAYDEMFIFGAFKRSISTPGRRVPLLSQHAQRSNPLGRATLLREDPAGLYGEFAVSKTQAGDEALELIRDGALDSFSVGFTGYKHERRNGIVVRQEAGIREASLVTFASYADAKVGGIRTWFDSLSEDERAEVQRMALTATDLSATTPDGDSEQAARNVDDPASATHDDIQRQFRAAKVAARMRGILP
jgi:uncharacterized protein